MPESSYNPGVEERPDHVLGLDALELRQLRYFIAVAEALNFTRAAADLHIAQQALSAAIRRLEDQLGVALFVRNTRKVRLTSAGEVLLPGARAVIAAASTALEEVRVAAAGRSGRITIGFSTAAGGIRIVRDILRTFAEAAPDVEIRTVEHDFADPSAGLADDRTQVAFIFGPPPAPGLSSVTLLEEPRLLAVRPEHPAATQVSIAADDLASLPWLRVPAPRGPWTDFWFPQVPGARPGPSIRTADEWVTAIEAGRGAAFTMPTVMTNFASSRIVVRAVEGVAPGAVLLAWRTADPDPLVRAFVAHARSIVPAQAS